MTKTRKAHQLNPYEQDQVEFMYRHARTVGKTEFDAIEYAAKSQRIEPDGARKILERRGVIDGDSD